MQLQKVERDLRAHFWSENSKTRPEVAFHPLIGLCRVKSVSTESSRLRVKVSLPRLYLYDFLFRKNVSGEVPAQYAGSIDT
jgi:hypothetical protein